MFSSADSVFNIMGLIILLAVIVAVVTHKESANIIKSFGSAFSGSVSAALGK